MSFSRVAFDPDPLMRLSSGVAFVAAGLLLSLILGSCQFSMGQAATFDGPSAVAVDSANSCLYPYLVVADSGGHAIREVIP